MDRLPKLRRRPKIVTPELAVTSIASPHTATAPDHRASFTPISPTSSPLAIPPPRSHGVPSGIPTLKSAASDSALGSAVTARRTRHSALPSNSSSSTHSPSPARAPSARDSTGSLLAFATSRSRVPSAPPAVLAARENARKSLGSLHSASSSRSSLVLSNAAAAGSQIPLPVSVTTGPLVHSPDAACSPGIPPPALALPPTSAPKVHAIQPPTLDTAAAVATTVSTFVTPPSAISGPSIVTTTASPTTAKRHSRIPSAFRSLPFRGPMKRSRSPAPPPISTSGAHFGNPSITAIAVAATPSPSTTAPALAALGHSGFDGSPASVIGASPRTKGLGHHRKVSSKGKFTGAIKSHFAAAQASWSSPRMSPILSRSRNSGSGLRTPSPKGAKMPPFMASSVRDVQAKFNELTWIERNRVAFGWKRARKGLTNSPPRPSTSATCAPTGLESLARKPSYRHPEPSQQGLDRYINIQPWNHNRITLNVPPDTQDYVNASPITLMSNGNPEGLPTLNYIAMQGPTDVSTPHVWRMVSESFEGEGVIVQLTNLVENFQNKCHAYFPLDKAEGEMRINEDDIWNDGWRATVKFDNIEMLADGAIEVRKLIFTVKEPIVPVPEKTVLETPQADRKRGVSNPKISLVSVTEDDESPPASPADPVMHSTTGTPIKRPTEAGAESEPPTPIESAAPSLHSDEQSAPPSPPSPTTPTFKTRELTIYHLFYTRWPDFGVPAAEDIPSFLYLMELSRQYNHVSTNPRIIHCSAGVGRTGTFIALEHLKRELDNGFFLGDGPAFMAMACVNSGASAAPGQEDVSPITPGAVDTRGDVIFSTVDALREQRKLMVQSEAQYVFLYKVLRMLWRDRYGLSEDEVAERAAKRQSVEGA